MNVGLAITRNAVRRPDSPALFGDHIVTYRELDERTNRIAHVLSDRFAIAKGDRVALFVPNRPEVLEVLGGIVKCGAVYVGLNFRLGPTEMEQVFDNAEPRLMITDSEHRAEAERVCSPLGVPVVDVDTVAYEELLASSSADAHAAVHEVRHDDDFCIVYTSGTTGRPKGVLFDHARALQHATVTCLEYDITPDSRYLVQIPHNSSVNITIVPCLVIGAALGFLDSRSFDPVPFARMVADHAVTHSFLVPTQLMRTLDRLPQSDDHLLSSLVTLGYGSSPISPDRLGELVSRLGPIFIQLYGMAEIASVGTLLRKHDHVAALGRSPQLLASCGQPSYAVDVRVVDGDGRDVAVGERGEVIFAGPHVMKGYYREPERTAEHLRDGWMHSGDVAVVDPEGFVYIVDRIKNLIIRGGLNIAPTEIENVLYRHEAVLECSVIGVPDPEWGEAIVAVVALKHGHTVEPEALRLHCRQSELSSIKVPVRVEVVDSLPKNAVGKIAKDELRRQHWGSGRQV